MFGTTILDVWYVNSNAKRYSGNKQSGIKVWLPEYTTALLVAGPLS